MSALAMRGMSMGPPSSGSGSTGTIMIIICVAVVIVVVLILVLVYVPNLNGKKVDIKEVYNADTVNNKKLTFAGALGSGPQGKSNNCINLYAQGGGSFVVPCNSDGTDKFSKDFTYNKVNKHICDKNNQCFAQSNTKAKDVVFGYSSTDEPGQQWTYDNVNGTFKNGLTGNCLDGTSGYQLAANTCDNNKKEQKWVISSK